MIFDHLYGTFPNASAFDLAALGVMLHDQKLYPGCFCQTDTSSKTT
jgi:phospholipase C